MILSFKKQFPEKILSGSKIHTIREDPHARWKQGRKIHMATGVRTKNYNCFKEDVCRSIQTIKIDYLDTGKKFIELFIGGVLFYKRVNEMTVLSRGMIELAKNDGFDSAEDFFKWFDHDFQGRIIHWTDFKY